MVDEVIATRFTVQIPDRTPFTLTWLLTEGWRVRAGSAGWA